MEFAAREEVVCATLIDWKHEIHNNSQDGKELIVEC